MTDPQGRGFGFSRQRSRLAYILVRRNLVSYALPFTALERRLLHHSISGQHTVDKVLIMSAILIGLPADHL